MDAWAEMDRRVWPMDVRPPLFPPRAAHIPRRHEQQRTRILSLVSAVSISCLILYGLANVIGSPKMMPAGRALTMVRLSNSPPKPVGAPPAPRQNEPSSGRDQPPPDGGGASAANSDLDVSTPQPFSRFSWSVHRIAARTNAVPTTGAPNSASGGNSAASGGSGVYDPYAGASPMRTAGGNVPADAALIQQTIARRISILLPNFRGVMFCSVNIDNYDINSISCTDGQSGRSIENINAATIGASNLRLPMRFSGGLEVRQ